jgi:putative addiction module component (TIGR02574 family)
MPTTLNDLYQAALDLPEDQRAELADRLLGTLSSDLASELHPAWKAELARRSAELDAGTVERIPWEEVRRKAWDTVDRMDRDA